MCMILGCFFGNDLGLITSKNQIWTINNAPPSKQPLQIIMLGIAKNGGVNVDPGFIGVHFSL